MYYIFLISVSILTNLSHRGKQQWRKFIHITEPSFVCLFVFFFFKQEKLVGRMAVLTQICTFVHKWKKFCKSIWGLTGSVVKIHKVCFLCLLHTYTWSWCFFSNSGERRKEGIIILWMYMLNVYVEICSCSCLFYFSLKYSKQKIWVHLVTVKFGQLHNTVIIHHK